MHAKGNRSQNFKSLNNLSLTKKSSRTQTTSHTQHRANVHPDQNWSGKRTKRHTSSSDNTALIASSLCRSPLHWPLREAQPSLPAPAKKGFGRRYSFCSVQPNTLPSNRTRISYCGLVTRPLLCLSYKPTARLHTVLVAQSHDSVHIICIVYDISWKVFDINSHIRSLFHLREKKFRLSIPRRPPTAILVTLYQYSGLPLHVLVCT